MTQTQRAPAPTITDAQLAAMSGSQRVQLLKLLQQQKYLQDIEDCKSLVKFIQQAWHVLEPVQPYSHGWHMDAICDHLEAVTNGEIIRLLINIPPGTMKSLATGVFWPAWEWGPKGMSNMRFIGASHEEGLATRDNLKMRRLISSEWYQTRWPTPLTGDQNQKTYFENSSTGWRQSCPVTAMTGRRGDRVLWDDPHSVEDAHSPLKLEGANRVFRETLPTRVNNPDSSAIVIVMQRLNKSDVAGQIIASDLGYEQLILPMEYEGPRKPTKIGFVDPRRKVDELLFPARFPRAVVDRDKKIMGEYAVAGQFQQRPSPIGGGILKATAHMRLWPAKWDIPDLFHITQSYDTAYTESTKNDPCACTVWGIFEHENRRQAVLLDAWTDHLDYPKLKPRVIEDWAAKYGGVKNNVMKPSRRPDVVLVEQKGSGISLLQDLHVSNIPAVGYNPGRADKITRAHLTAPMLELDCFWVLESKREPGMPISWARPFLKQVDEFPAGDHDDYVDTFTQCAIYLRDTGQLEVDVAPLEDPEEIDYNKQRKKLVNPYG